MAAAIAGFGRPTFNPEFHPLFGSDDAIDRKRSSVAGRQVGVKIFDNLADALVEPREFIEFDSLPKLGIVLKMIAVNLTNRGNIFLGCAACQSHRRSGARHGE